MTRRAVGTVFVLNGTNQLTLPFQYTSPKYVFAHRAQKTLVVLIENNTLPTRLAMADGRPTNSALRIVHLVLGNTYPANQFFSPVRIY